MKRISTLLLLILISSSTYLHAQIVDETKYTKPIKVACIGNSITFGSGLQDRIKNSYPGQLSLM